MIYCLFVWLFILGISEATQRLYVHRNIALKNILFLFGSSILLFSCQKGVIIPPPEYGISEKSAPIREPSYISIPISLSYQTIRESVTKNLGPTLYVDDSFTNNDEDNVKIKVVQNGNLHLNGYQDFLKISLPVHVFFTGRYRACGICPEIIKSTDFTMEADIVSKISLSPSWVLTTQTESKGFSIKKDPYMSLGPLNINIRTVVEQLLKNQLGDLAKMIDKTIREQVDLKKYAEQAWKELQKPILADSAYNAWLYFAPKEFILSPLRADKDRLSIKGALLTDINTKLGDKPLIRETPVPRLTLRDDIPSGFKIDLLTEIDFNEATRQARLAFKDSTFEVSSKKRITVNDIELYGRGNEVFVKVQMSGALRAVVYLKGKPAFDQDGQEIYFQDLDYELNTSQVLLKSASWLLKGTLKKKMDSTFRYPVKQDLDVAAAAVRSYLSGYNYRNLLEINGNLGSLTLKDVGSDERVIRAKFSAEGRASLKILGLTF